MVSQKLIVLDVDAPTTLIEAVIADLLRYRKDSGDFPLEREGDESE